MNKYRITTVISTILLTFGCSLGYFVYSLFRKTKITRKGR